MTERIYFWGKGGIERIQNREKEVWTFFGENIFGEKGDKEKWREYIFGKNEGQKNDGVNTLWGKRRHRKMMERIKNRGK